VGNHVPHKPSTVLPSIPGMWLGVKVSVGIATHGEGGGWLLLGSVWWTMRPSHVVGCGRPCPPIVSLGTLTVTSLAMLLSVFGQGDLVLDASKDQDHPRFGGSARMSHRPYSKCQMRAPASWSREIGTSRGSWTLESMARSVHGVFILARGNMRVSALEGPSSRGGPRNAPRRIPQGPNPPLSTGRTNHKAKKLFGELRASKRL
jgi:hypothetical protein